MSPKTHKRPQLRQVLHFACFAAFFSLSLPIAQVILDLRHTPLYWSWVVFACAEALGFGGMALAGQKGWRRALTLAATPVWGCGLFLLFWQIAALPLEVSISFGVLCAPAWLLGIVLFGRPHRMRDFFFLAFWYIVCGIVLQVRGTSCESLLIPLLLSGCCYAAERNYAAVDGLMQRRGHAVSELPPKSRKMNLFLLGCVGVLVLILVLARPVLMPACAWVFREIGLLFLSLVRLFNWGMLKVLREPNGPNLSEEDMAEAQTQDSPFTEAEDSEAAWHPELQVGFLILIVAVVVAIIVWRVIAAYRWRKRIGVRRKRRSILQRILRFLRGRKLFRLFATPDENDNYIDQEEAIDADGVVQQLPPELDKLRKWRRAVRALAKQPPGRARFLEGWMLSVVGLKLRGVKVTDSDTPLEILEKSKQVLDGASYAAATECCNALRYGGEETVTAQQALDEVLHQLRKESGKRR